MSDNPFETSAQIYDQWYDDYPSIFHSELLALRALLPRAGRWVEVGVGTGRFAVELGIVFGIEPTEGMATLARQRGITVTHGVAEALPLESDSIDCIFFITTLCFVTDLQMAMAEAFRVVKPGGYCIVGLLPLDSPLGKITQERAANDLFFKNARLRTKHEVLAALENFGFNLEQSSQTLLGSPEGFESQQPSQEAGHDRGSFVVFRAAKPLESGAK